MYVLRRDLSVARQLSDDAKKKLAQQSEKLKRVNVHENHGEMWSSMADNHREAVC